MAIPDDKVARVHAETREEWRQWLSENGEDSSAAWLVSWRKQTGRPAMSYEESVEEALCFGWIDSKGRKLDDERTMLYFAPRKPGSGWSRPNKVRIERLESAGLMTARGRAVIDAAKADGSWTLLDDVEDLRVPDDLTAAFARYPGAANNFEAFPRSVKRATLEWIVQAKRAETRRKRVEETAELAGRNERAAQWRPKP